ncbi:MAG: hypothetical protein ACYSUT_11775 [Planctomycetota bacterium]
MKTALMLSLVAMLTLSGCATVGMNGAFDEEGLPGKQYYVVGGFNLNYVAPVSGTAYVVEENSRKLIITESVLRNNYFSFDIDPSSKSHKTRFEAMGIDVKEAELGLYFVPTEEGEVKANK